MLSQRSDSPHGVFHVRDDFVSDSFKIALLKNEKHFVLKCVSQRIFSQTISLNHDKISMRQITYFDLFHVTSISIL